VHVEEAFDRFTRLASVILNTPVLLVSLVDRDRQFFKSSIGLKEPWASSRQTPLSHSSLTSFLGGLDLTQKYGGLTSTQAHDVDLARNGGKISVLAQADEGTAILFSVTDSGYGIPQAAFEQIFDRVDRIETNWIKGTSTGFGLPFSQMAIAAHGGKIWVDSEIGQGTSFYFTIPCG
jgi:Histidine kinase-, DNA gyrase B-, and HSP90-like ATPase